MIIHRARSLLRLSSRVFQNLLRNKSDHSNHKNKTYILYRDPVLPEEYIKSIKFRNDLISGFVWWWLLWRLAMEYPLILGPEIPDMSSWTDEELGIPPLEEDP